MLQALPVFDRTGLRSSNLSHSSLNRRQIALVIGLAVSKKSTGQQYSRGRAERDENRERNGEVTAWVCAKLEYTMLEGGRAVIWHLVSARRAARHPKDSRTNC
ncbi:uncharacterized protein LOC118648125 [Monomorium pharaonis]|uniref:uncharacterized protein LOC118648125 n=1 Tax=Monomorium pharaonis TaxID=307658 RepID=UPI0017470571|nr:uncharacterized protein LOC118648125 [Monomorium pharaonis]